MEKLYKIAHALEGYLIIIAAVSALNFYIDGIVVASNIMFWFFMGPLIIIILPAMAVAHILILGERADIIFEKKEVPKGDLRILNIFCVFGSLAIVYVIWLFFFVGKNFLIACFLLNKDCVFYSLYFCR